MVTESMLHLATNYVTLDFCGRQFTLTCVNILYINVLHVKEYATFFLGMKILQ